MMQLNKIMRYLCRSNNRGFTLIEIIAVLVILSIIAVVVISRGGSSAEATLKSSAEALKGHIRFAQMRAMNSESSTPTTCFASFGISATSNSYSMFRDCSTGNQVALPGASGDTVSLPGMTLTATDITFDRWGRPCTDLYGNTPATINNITLTLRHPAVTQPETITITKNTGFVP